MIGLTEFKDKQKGRDVFVFGTGPSLHSFNVDIINGRPVVCVNGSILKYKNPTYYLTSDGHQVLKRHWKIVQSGAFPVIAGSQGASDHIRLYGPIDPSRHCSFMKENTRKMDPNADKLIFGASSVHCAIHFAVILGAKRIILVGCDCESSGGQHRFYDFSGEEKDVCAVKGMEKFVNKAINPTKYFQVFFNYYKDMKKLNPGVHIECLAGRLVREKVFPPYKLD